MNIKYRKRAEGGYYAYATMPEGHEICVIVWPMEHHTPNKTYRTGWYAQHGKRSTVADTRQEAVLALVSTH